MKSEDLLATFLNSQNDTILLLASESCYQFTNNVQWFDFLFIFKLDLFRSKPKPILCPIQNKHVNPRNIFFIIIWNLFVCFRSFETVHLTPDVKRWPVSHPSNTSGREIENLGAITVDSKEQWTADLRWDIQIDGSSVQASIRVQVILGT